jgi:hypothetical protein
MSIACFLLYKKEGEVKKNRNTPAHLYRKKQKMNKPEMNRYSYQQEWVRTAHNRYITGHSGGNG